MAGTALELVGLALRGLALITVNNVLLSVCCQANLRTCRDRGLPVVVPYHQCRSERYFGSTFTIFRQTEKNPNERNYIYKWRQ